MRPSRILHLLGALLMFIGVAMLAPIPFSLYYHSGDHFAFAGAAGGALLLGFLLRRLTHFEGELRHREAFVIVALTWISFSCVGSLPYMITGAIPSFTNAFFETASGFTTTGASILTDIEALPRGVLLWRALTQWIGGMGIIVMSLAILPFLGVGGMQLYKAELMSAADRLTPRVTQTAKILWGVYAGMTALEATLLVLGGMSVFDALCHSFATIATGGFSTRNASIAAFDSAYIQYVIAAFCYLAGINFFLHYRIVKGDAKSLFRNVEWRSYSLIIAIAVTVVFAKVAPAYPSIERAFRDSFFQVVNIMTTTGFATADYELWPYLCQFVLLGLMLIGACGGSTGGGMKVVRVHILFKFVIREMTRLLHPHAVVPVRLGKTAMDRDLVANILGFAILYGATFFLGTLAMTAMGNDIVTSLGAVGACLGNVGPGLGAVGPTDNYAHLSHAARWLLSLLMLMGRIEIYTLVILFFPSFWKK
ncbi:MAG: TrkH family potassium uptake protein [Candidatus Krumholzibacteria bacterium]|nr:TrkH family potassium uptake protein [Candidatus Krumholzibacteria bacterium]MDH4336762.1 TrkH family potassium uptake protein [Candidatus Krumholzibacteria bacterium]MDH5269471.1 TrkH family potassium uptake protein [Candidatus Krumholzibacteria bacterium]MDH5626857.1 TrkH family potassium uptake protein [Candidatus Krumholzibacteria bacterium]